MNYLKIGGLNQMSNSESIKEKTARMNLIKKWGNSEIDYWRFYEFEQYISEYKKNYLNNDFQAQLEEDFIKEAKEETE